MKRMSTNISSKRHEPHTSLKTLISKEPPNESAYSNNIKVGKEKPGLQVPVVGNNRIMALTYGLAPERI